MLSTYITIISYCHSNNTNKESTVDDVQQKDSLESVAHNVENLLRQSPEDDNSNKKQQNSEDDHSNKKRQNNNNKSSDKKQIHMDNLNPSKNQQINLNLSEKELIKENNRSPKKSKKMLRSIVKAINNQIDFNTMFTDISKLKIFHGFLVLIEIETECPRENGEVEAKNGKYNSPKKPFFLVRTDIGPKYFRFFYTLTSGSYSELFDMSKVDFQIIGTNFNIAKHRRYSDCVFLGDSLPLIFDAYNEGADTVAPQYNWSFNIFTFSKMFFSPFIGLIHDKCGYNYDGLFGDLTTDQKQVLGKDKKSEDFYLNLGIKLNSSLMQGLLYTVVQDVFQAKKNVALLLNLWTAFLCLDVKWIPGQDQVKDLGKNHSPIAIRTMLNLFESFRKLTGAEFLNNKFFKNVGILLGILYEKNHLKIVFGLTIGVFSIKIIFDTVTQRFTIKIDFVYYYVNSIDSYLDSLPPIKATPNNLPEALNV